MLQQPAALQQAHSGMIPEDVEATTVASTCQLGGERESRATQGGGGQIVAKVATSTKKQLPAEVTAAEDGDPTAGTQEAAAQLEEVLEDGAMVVGERRVAGGEGGELEAEGAINGPSFTAPAPRRPTNRTIHRRPPALGLGGQRSGQNIKCS